ncbi:MULTISPECIES: class I SAM-dependent methyltransferase [Thalassospira]|uniref:Methyltransferase type 11 domain-containing protein n=1 Tax=Thalassospira profundimaris TaxID=502049 RepID=A0A367VJN2_9PROT|nr:MULTISPECIES: class I SAM-dependent methyltransferase [Thalassospira]KZB70940.1 hypothetical protein AUQ43_08830 [Thalassospira sp. MCCC 1A01148]MBR9899339.1 class I SAM-dependent methyltransferase [Rhodospirillales bacterium]RCK25417.1 hypothetical protein TH6_02025 [Thalassospira profundimaris]
MKTWIKKIIEDTFVIHAYRFMRIKGILHKPVMPVREFIRIPAIYDRLSFLIQMRYYSRIRALEGVVNFDPRGQEAHFQKLLDINVAKVKGTRVLANRKAERHYAVAILPFRETKSEKLLSIGVRSAHELLLAWSFGFSWKNIQAVDLFSTHPKIRVMNMEELAFADNSFDCVVIANAISDTWDVPSAIREAVRVLRPGGRLVFNVMYEPDAAQDWPGASFSGSDARALLEELDMRIYYWTTRNYRNRAGHNEADHLIGTMKPENGNSLFDEMRL